MEVFVYIQEYKEFGKIYQYVILFFQKTIYFWRFIFGNCHGSYKFSYYFLKPEPSCFDGILNQSEVKMDCGGSCQACKLKLKYKIWKLFHLIHFFLGNGKYDAMAQVKI